MSIRLTDIVRSYNGEGDVDAWLDRLEMVYELQKPRSSSSDLVAVIPLLLEGPAYDVYAQMSDDVRKDESKLKAGLKAAFGLSPALAFVKFRTRTLAVGESPDAFVAELRRLARTVAYGADMETVDQFVL